MTPNELVLFGLNRSAWIFHQLVDDLTPAEWLTRAVPGSNPVAWIVGHLIAVESGALQLFGVAGPKLPDPNFAARHGRGSAPATGEDYGDPERLIALFDSIRAATIQYATTLPAAEFDKPIEHPMFQKLGQLLALLPVHTTLHCGQISTARRSLGKPPAF